MGGWGNEYKLSNIESHRFVNLSFGAKKKEKKNNTQSLLGDLSTHNKKAKKKGTEYSDIRNPVFGNRNHNYYSTVMNYWSVTIKVIR